MKCRLYRGPFNGKIIHVDPRRLLYGRIEMAKPVKFNALQYDFDALSSNLTFETVTYVMKRMNLNLDGVTYHAPAMHPDGSLYLEYDKPRRSKK